ncbi:MAG: 4Fe-4S binding protein, partial [Muribaculaceae bacterium]|nr:4Fe-4S binding protein [Muribaculaceae bacterium]
MGSIKEYFSSLGKGIASLVKGMEVTGKEFVTPKITERYPEDRDTFKWPERFRAELYLKYDDEGRHKCIACGICERSCPNGTITIKSKMVDTPDGKKKKRLDKWIYDLGSCTFCQLCVTNCPTGAIDFDNDFEQAVFTRDKLVKQLNYLPKKEDPAPSPEELAKAAAEREAKIAAAKAAAEAKKAAAKAADATTEATASTPVEAPAPAAAPAEAPAVGDDKIAKARADFEAAKA